MLASAITSDWSLHSAELLRKALIIFLFHKHLSKSTLLERLNLFGNCEAEVVTLGVFFALDVIKSWECLTRLKPYRDCEKNSWRRLLNGMVFC